MSERFLRCVKVPNNSFASSCEDVQFLSNIELGDESWVYGYDPEAKQQSSQWKQKAKADPDSNSYGSKSKVSTTKSNKT